MNTIQQHPPAANSDKMPKTSNDKLSPGDVEFGTPLPYLAGKMLRHGFSLLPIDPRAEHPELLAIHAACTPQSTMVEVRHTEHASRHLVAAKAIVCMPLFTSTETAKVSAAAAPVLPLLSSTTHNARIDAVFEQLVERLELTPEITISALVYLSRLVHRGVLLTPRTALKASVGAIMLAIKMLLDVRLSASWVAEQAGLHLDVVVSVEQAVWQALGYDLFIHPSEFLCTLFSMRTCQCQIPALKRLPWRAFSEQLALPEVKPYATNANEIVQSISTKTERLSALALCRQRGGATRKALAVSAISPSHHQRTFATHSLSSSLRSTPGGLSTDSPI